MIKSLPAVEKEFDMNEVDKATPNWLKWIMMGFIVLLFFGLVFLGQADAKMTDGKNYLVIMTATNTSTTRFTRVYYEVDNMTQCFQLIENARIDVSHGGDAEASVVMYCTPTKKEE